MTDTATNLKQVADILEFDPFADFGVVLGVLGGGCWHGMIQCDDNPFGETDVASASFLEDSPDSG
jgi:hypothetical protein